MVWYPCLSTTMDVDEGRVDQQRKGMKGAKKREGIKLRASAGFPAQARCVSGVSEYLVVVVSHVPLFMVQLKS